MSPASTTFDADGLTPELRNGGARHQNYTERDVQHLRVMEAQRAEIGRQAQEAQVKKAKEAELAVRKGKQKA